MCQCYSLNSPHPLLPTLRPQVYCLWLCLYSCPADRPDNTTFLDSVCVHRHIWLFAAPWIVTHQAPHSVHGIFQQEYWSRLSRPAPGDLAKPGIGPETLTSPELAGRFFTSSATYVLVYLLFSDWLPSVCQVLGSSHHRTQFGSFL